MWNRGSRGVEESREEAERRGGLAGNAGGGFGGCVWGGWESPVAGSGRDGDTGEGGGGAVVFWGVFREGVVAGLGRRDPPDGEVPLATAWIWIDDGGVEMWRTVGRLIAHLVGVVRMNDTYLLHWYKLVLGSPIHKLKNMTMQGM